MENDRFYIIIIQCPFKLLLYVFRRNPTGSGEWRLRHLRKDHPRAVDDSNLVVTFRKIHSGTRVGYTVVPSKIDCTHVVLFINAYSIFNMHLHFVLVGKCIDQIMFQSVLKPFYRRSVEHIVHLFGASVKTPGYGIYKKRSEERRVGTWCGARRRQGGGSTAA